MNFIRPIIPSLTNVYWDEAPMLLYLDFTVSEMKCKLNLPRNSGNCIASGGFRNLQGSRNKFQPLVYL